MKFTMKLLALIFVVLMLANAGYAESMHEPIDMPGSPFLDFFLKQGGTLALAIIIAIVAYVKERSKQQRENKIKAYEELILSLGVYIRATAENKPAALDKFSDASLTFCVWATKPVLTALSEYIHDGTDPAKKTNEVLMRKHFSGLVAAIREDIGIESTVNDAVGTIAFGYEWDKATRAASAQVPNPLFVEAQDISQQLSLCTLNDNAKTAWTKRFHDLEQEQQQLWSLAGQIDLYNSRVVDWESSLQSFIHDAQLILPAPTHS